MSVNVEARGVVSTYIGNPGWHREVTELRLAGCGGRSAARHLLELVRDLDACYKEQ